MDNKTLFVTDSAKEQLTKIIGKSPGTKLRITVMPGGCNGFEYKLGLEKEIHADDRTIEVSQEVTILIDNASLDLIGGAALDYKADLIGAAFSLSNPQATSSCGCGNSFSI